MSKVCEFVVYKNPWLGTGQTRYEVRTRQDITVLKFDSCQAAKEAAHRLNTTSPKNRLEVLALEMINVEPRF